MLSRPILTWSCLDLYFLQSSLGLEIYVKKLDKCPMNEQSWSNTYVSIVNYFWIQEDWALLVALDMRYNLGQMMRGWKMREPRNYHAVSTIQMDMDLMEYCNWLNQYQYTRPGKSRESSSRGIFRALQSPQNSAICDKNEKKYVCQMLVWHEGILKSWVPILTPWPSIFNFEF